MQRIKVTPNPVEQGKIVTIEVENATSTVHVEITKDDGTTETRPVPHDGHATWSPPDGSSEAWLNAPGCAEVHLVVLGEAAATD